MIRNLGTAVLCCFLCCLFPGAAYAQKSQCSDVLKDGTKAVRLFQENDTYRRLLETKLMNSSARQSRSDTSLTGNIPVGDIVLGAGFTDKSYDDYKSYLQKDSKMQIDTSHALDVMISSGDPGILNSWLACMQTKSGLGIWFKNIHAKSAVLVIQWFPAAGVGQVFIDKNFKLPKNIRVTSGDEFLKGTMPIVAGTNHEVAFELEGPEQNLPITLNAVSDNLPRGADSTFLPSRMKLIRRTRPYAFNVSGGVCSTSPTIFLPALHHSGTTLPTTTYCSSLSSGWRFSKRDGDVSVTTSVIPSFIPNVQIAVAPYTWTGDDQFNVSLGCSSSTAADIQCSATTRLVEERFDWTPASE